MSKQPNTHWLACYQKGKKVQSLTSQGGSHEPELNPISATWSNWEHWFSPLDGMLVHHRATPTSMLPVPIYTPGWRETMWGKVSCPRKQHNGRDWVHWATHPQISSPTRLPHPFYCYQKCYQVNLIFRMLKAGHCSHCCHNFWVTHWNDPHIP